MNPETNLAARAAANLEQLRATRPLVHNITNFVVMNFTANVLLAAGAAPVMAHAANEVEEMVALARALVLNLGTLDDTWVAAMLKAGKKAVALVRGNASEILALAGAGGRTRGVDSADSVEAAAQRAGELARELDVPVAITGAVDFITDGKRVLRVANGHPLMSRVTGMGCGATAIIGAFAGVDSDPVSAAATALAFYGLAGEHAADGAVGPGSFTVRFLDALHNLTPEDVLHGARLREG